MSGMTNIQGEVDYMNQSGGYGFITSPEIDDDVFFDVTDASFEVQTDSEVVFDIVDKPEGKRAKNIRQTNK